jgi:hypothetical protein
VLTNASAPTLLFAEDNEDFQKPGAALLCKCGYRVISASDGNAALQKAREFDGPIHLLLSDVEMPGMSGIELANQIIRDRPNTQILLISCVDSELLVRKHGWQFLKKPLEFHTLRDRIRDLLSETGVPGERG